MRSGLRRKTGRRVMLAACEQINSNTWVLYEIFAKWMRMNQRPPPLPVFGGGLRMEDQWIGFRMTQQRVRFPRGRIRRFYIGERKLIGRIEVLFVLAGIPVGMTKTEI